MTREQAAWVAGILEGEGYLQRANDTRYQQKRNRIIVANNDIRLLDRLRSWTGIGHIHSRKVYPGKASAHYDWVVTRGSHVEWLLDQCSDWLIRWLPT